MVSSRRHGRVARRKAFHHPQAGSFEPEVLALPRDQQTLCVRRISQAPKLAAIRALRWVCFVLSKADTNRDAARETQRRLACLRGEVPLPWSWSAF